MSVIRRDGTARVKIISPGVGTSGFYSPEVLEKSAERFKGASCYWDHPTLQEDAQRPERSLRDLAGKIIGTPTWDANGKTGPGIYADVQVFKGYRESVDELAPHIGMSIRATGKARHGDVAGRKMPIIEGIETVKSVDFVTLPGRGGEILQLFEAARAPTTQDAPKGQTPVDPTTQLALQEVQAELAEVNRKLSEAQTEKARLSEALLFRNTFDFVTAEVAKYDLPDGTKARIAESLCRAPVLKDGKLDEDGERLKIRETALYEAKYLEENGGRGAIRNMGGAAKTANVKESDDLMAESFLALGLTETMAKHAVRGHS